MKLRTLSLISLSIAALAAGGLAAAADAAGDRNAAEQRLLAAGYQDVRELEFEQGVWEAEVRRADGRYAEVAVDAASGEVFDARDGRPLLDAARIREALSAQGYRDLRDLDRDGALWDVDATDRDGARVELRVSAFDARVLSAALDDEGHDD
jgi:hypothetical protein